MLYNINFLLDYKVSHIIHSLPILAAADHDVRTATAKVRLYNAKHGEGMCVCLQDYKVCSARPAVHESVRTPHK